MANRARNGFAQYQRQSLIGGAYGLVTSLHQHPQSGLGAEEAVVLRPGEGGGGGGDGEGGGGDGGGDVGRVG